MPKNSNGGGPVNERDTNVIKKQVRRSQSLSTVPGARRLGDDEAIEERRDNLQQNNADNNRENQNDEAQRDNNAPQRKRDTRQKRTQSMGGGRKEEERRKSEDGAALMTQMAQLEAEEKKREAERKKKEEERKKKKKEEEERKKKKDKKKKEPEYGDEVKIEKKEKYSDDDLTNATSIEQILKEGDSAEVGKKGKSKAGNSKEYNEIMRKSRRLKKYMSQAMDGKNVSYTRAKQIEDLADELDKDMAKYQKRKGKEKNLNEESRNRLKSIKEARKMLKETKESIKELKPKKNSFEVLDIAIKEEEKFRKQLAKDYKEHPTQENFNKMKDSVYRSMFLETLKTEYGAEAVNLSKMDSAAANKAEKKLRSALKSGFQNNIEVMQKVANESTFGVKMDKLIKENLADNKYVSHEKMKDLRDKALEDGLKENKKKQDKYYKNINGYTDETYTALKTEEAQLDMTAKMFGSKFTAKKVNKNKLYDELKTFSKDSEKGMKIDMKDLFIPSAKNAKLEPVKPARVK